MVLATQSLFSFQHVWFAWMIIVAAQIPCALLYAIVYRSLEWYTQRRRMEEERRRADARIREQAALLDKAQDAILVHDLEWRAQYWNPSAERLYGWTFDEVKEKNLRTEVFKADEAKLLDVLQEALRKGEWGRRPGTQQNREGKISHRGRAAGRWCGTTEGRPRSVLVINTDMTERKKLEAQFLRTQRMESIGTLAGGIAHDLNNVLSPILMCVELLKMKLLGRIQREDAGHYGLDAKRGSDMVKQVLKGVRARPWQREVRPANRPSSQGDAKDRQGNVPQDHRVQHRRRGHSTDSGRCHAGSSNHTQSVRERARRDASEGGKHRHGGAERDTGPGRRLP